MDKHISEAGNWSVVAELEEALAQSSPPTSPASAELDEAMVALASEVRSKDRLVSVPVRRSPWLVATVGLAAAVTMGAAAYAASVIVDNGPWNNLTVEAESQAVRFEWQVALPDGTRCVNRLTGVGLTPDQQSIVQQALSDPAKLLSIDDGTVREEFLRNYDESPDQQGIADRATWEAWIDAGYAAVEAMNVSARREALPDEDLTVIPGSAENEVFLHSSMRVVTDGITASGVDAMQYLTPETACEIDR